MELVYKKIEKKDKEQLFNLIDVVLNGLPDQAHFIPYEQWKLDRMFDEVNMRLCMVLIIEKSLLELHNYTFHKIC